MTAVYIDSIFVLNGLVDYLLLLCTARLAGIPLRRRLYLAAGVLGGLYAVAAMLPAAAFLRGTAAKLAVGVLLALVAFGCERYFFRLAVLFLTVSCGFAGCVLGLGLVTGISVPAVDGVLFTDIGAGALLVTATVLYLFFSAVFRASARHRVCRETINVRLKLDGQTTEVTALLDNGCGVRDPVSGQPVLVVEADAVKSVFSRPVRALLTPEALAMPASLPESLRQLHPHWRCFLIPYRSVGVNSGLLLAMRFQEVCVGETIYPGLLVGLAPGGFGTGYQALWGGKWGKRDGCTDGKREVAAAAGAAGDSDRAAGPLYRRQRYASAAAGKRA